MATSHEILQSLGLALGGGGLLVVLSRRSGLPAILLLMVGGWVLGPHALSWIHAESLGPALSALVSLSIGFILFEGGLSLRSPGRDGTAKVILRLVTLGVLITWLIVGMGIHLVSGLPLGPALLAASLVTVTGPTVIVPLLRRLAIKPPVSTILHWEGVMVDAVGVFLAVLCYEWVAAGQGWHAAGGFGIRVAIGAAIGVAGGVTAAITLKRGWIPAKHANLWAMSACLLTFTSSEIAMIESGLLAVTTAGLVFSALKPVELSEIRAFKAEIVDLLIGGVFLLLVSRIDPTEIVAGGWSLAACVILVLLVRPVSVLVCTRGSGLDWKQRAFLSWLAPRGIVAASMASLFAIRLQQQPDVGFDSVFLERFVFAAVAVTVVLHGITAGPLARRLHLRVPRRDGWLIVGAHELAMRIAEIIHRECHVPVCLVDTNARNVLRARETGLTALHADALEVGTFQERHQIGEIGNLLALTDNAELNRQLANSWAGLLGRDHVFGWFAGEQPSSLPVEAAVLDDAIPPGMISRELRDGTARIDVLTGYGPDTVGMIGIEVIAVLGRRRVRFSTAGMTRAKDDIGLLVLHRHRGMLDDVIESPEPLPADSNPADLCRRLIELAVTSRPGLDAGELADACRRSTGMLPTYLGQGAVLFHLYSEKVREPLVLRASVAGGQIGYQEPINHAWIVISPVNDPERHLATLAEIARATRLRLSDACEDKVNQSFTS